MINVRLFNSLFELLEAFPTEESCIKYLESLRWKEGIVSPFDPTSKVYICNKFNLSKIVYIMIWKSDCWKFHDFN